MKYNDEQFFCRLFPWARSQQPKKNISKAHSDSLFQESSIPQKQKNSAFKASLKTFKNKKLQLCHQGQSQKIMRKTSTLQKIPQTSNLPNFKLSAPILTNTVNFSSKIDWGHNNCLYSSNGLFPMSNRGKNEKPRQSKCIEVTPKKSVLRQSLPSRPTKRPQSYSLSVETLKLQNEIAGQLQKLTIEIECSSLDLPCIRKLQPSPEAHDDYGLERLLFSSPSKVPNSHKRVEKPFNAFHNSKEMNQAKHASISNCSQSIMTNESRKNSQQPLVGDYNTCVSQMSHNRLEEMSAIKTQSVNDENQNDLQISEVINQEELPDSQIQDSLVHCLLHRKSKFDHHLT